MRRHSPLRSGRAPRLLATVAAALSTAGLCLVPAAASARAATEKVLISFAGPNGAGPLNGVIHGPDGRLYGTTVFGGRRGLGDVYSLTPSGSGYAEKVLFTFDNTDGARPGGNVALDAHGDLFGDTDIYNFKGGNDGSNPFAVLTVDGHTGVIYGTTEYGGGSGSYGTAFSLTPAGSGYTERVLHSFATPRDGDLPQAPLLREPGGDLFGVTDIGGIGCSGIGCSTVFDLTPAGSGYAFRVIHRFTGPPDGAEAEWAGLIPGPAGTLIGATRSGGTASSCADGGPGGAAGCGTIYQITR